MNSRLWILVVIVSLAAGPAQGACGGGGYDANKIIIGRVQRCESARFHLRALAEALDWNLEEQLENPEANLHSDVKRGYERTKNGIVVVVSVESHFAIPLGKRGDADGRPEAQCIALPETVRYWWLGTVEECKSAAAQRSVELRVRSPFCDNLPFFNSCLLGMETAELLSSEMLPEFGADLQRLLRDGSPAEDSSNMEK